jgi:hypothetical protein
VVYFIRKVVTRKGETKRNVETKTPQSRNGAEAAKAIKTSCERPRRKVQRRTEAKEESGQVCVSGRGRANRKNGRSQGGLE